MPNIGEVTANSIIHFDNFDWVNDELAFAEKHDIRMIFYTDEGYPSRLKNMTKALCCYIIKVQIA